MPALVEHIINRLPKQARSPLVPHLHSGYRTSSVISTARSSFGEGAVEVIDRIIALAPLPQLARSALKAVTHTVASVAGSVWSFFFR